jgi:hypothetical protein
MPRTLNLNLSMHPYMLYMRAISLLVALPLRHELQHQIVHTKIPVLPVRRLRVHLDHVHTPAPRREDLRDVERERGLVACGQVGGDERVVVQDGVVDDAVGVDEDGRVARDVVHGLAVEAHEVEEGREVRGGCGGGGEDCAIT